jgi:molecular chaperone GrpE (heat shock protein)
LTTPPTPPRADHDAAPASGPDPLDVVADVVDGVREELATLNDQFRRRLLNDREARRTAEALQAELEHNRRAAEGRTVQPLLYDLVLLLDRVERSADGSGGLADSVAAELLTILEKYGMRRLPAQAGPFDPALQEALAAVPAPRPELVGQVAEIVRHGYVMDERVVRPQQVRVHT